MAQPRPRDPWVVGKVEFFQLLQPLEVGEGSVGQPPQLTAASAAGQHCTFTPDGKTLIYSTGGEIKLMSLKTLEVVAKLEGSTAISPGALSHDDEIIAAIAVENTKQLWDFG